MSILESTTESLLDCMPGILWIKDVNSEYIACNEGFKQFTRLPSKNILINNYDCNLPWEKYAGAYLEGDKQVVLTGKKISFLHPVRRYNGDESVIISTKSPWRDKENNIIGIVGSVTVVSSTNNIRNILELYKYDTNLLDNNNHQYILDKNFEHFDLSKNETLCLFYLVRCKTAKEISIILCKSIRTIEKQIDNIRIKLGCQSKSEVINFAIMNGFVDYIHSDYCNF